MRSDEPSPLTKGERALLEGFLRYDFAGVQELREQSENAAAKRGCECGCGTIEFVLDRASLSRSEAINPVPVDATVRDSNGDEVGGLILFLKDGVMESLEVYSHADPLPLPDVEEVTWRA